MEQDEHVRWSWNMYPANRLDSSRMVVPLGCMYTPLGQRCVELGYEPLRCACGGILNPYCEIDYRSRTWGCPLCRTQNTFPAQYAQMSEHNRPRELQKGSETVEYVTQAARAPPTFVFVVDTCVETEEELQGLKAFLMVAISKLPAYCNICLITYGATIQLHELGGATEYPRSLVFRGSKEVTVADMKKVMPEPSRFVGALGNTAVIVTSIIQDLAQDLWPTPKNHRPLRCTGAAFSAAASILEIVAPNTGSCVIGFLSGVCTEGPGISVPTSREHMIRGHADIRDNTATACHWEASCTYYDNLMHRMVQQGHSLTCFTAALDQTGVAEMKLCLQASGGMVVVSPSWHAVPLNQSLVRFFEHREDGNLRMGLNATFDVITSPTWKIMGVIGPCVGTGNKSSSVADYEIGMGGTCQWTTCMLDHETTLAVYFDATPAPPQNAKKVPHRFVQFITKYEAGSETRTRVTTLSHLVQEPTSFPDLANAFDQETAAVLLARQAVHKTDTTPLPDVMRWLDRTVVRLVSRFGTYTRNVPSSLQLPVRFSFFPGFMYHLRRSAYMQVFNSSPDETAMMRLILLRSSVLDSIIQIQPTLYSYTMQGGSQPVPLDSTAILPDNILLLDTFFEVLVHNGETVAAWRNQGYADMPEYAYFREFIDEPVAFAKTLVESRYPAPRFLVIDKDAPDARILYNRINPARSYNAASGEQYGSKEGELFYTDDASMSVFMDHLKKLAVSQ